MIDGALALWNAILETFCHETRLEFYHRCYRIVTGKANKSDFSHPFVLNCLSHSMRASSVMCKKYYKRQFLNDALLWISHLFMATTISDIDLIVHHIFTVLLLKQNSEMVEESYNFLKTYNEELPLESDVISNDDDDADDAYVNDDDFFSNVKAWDIKQEFQSPFLLRYGKILDDIKRSNVYAMGNNASLYPNNNLYFCEKFAEKIKTTLLPRLCSTSGLMLGDLSRHSRDDNQSPYSKFRSDYMKIKSYSEKKNIQSICESNRTQGVIEEHFYQLKHVYLDNIRSSRIDKFIVKYEKEIATSCSLFGENLLHHGYIKRKVSTTAKSRKEESKALLKVDFKKRKRRYSGYFTSKQAAKKLKYVSSSIDESQNNRPSLKSDIRNQQPDIINREEEQQERTFVSLGKNASHQSSGNWKCATLPPVVK